jgi:branched-chain amino acid aminotransferase
VAGAQKLLPTMQAGHERIYQVVLELAAETGLGCTVGDFSLAQLYAADEVFVTGTIGSLVPVLTIDGRQIGITRPGPVTALPTKAFADLTATTGTPVC